MRRQQIITADKTQVKRYAQYSLDAIRFAAHCVNDMLKDLLKKDPKTLWCMYTNVNKSLLNS